MDNLGISLRVYKKKELGYVTDNCDYTCEIMLETFESLQHMFTW